MRAQPDVTAPQTLLLIAHHDAKRVSPGAGPCPGPPGVTTGADLRSRPKAGPRTPHTLERWNGNGYPNGAKREEIPIPMRIIHLTHDMEAIARHDSPERALEAARERGDRTSPYMAGHSC